MVDEDVRERPEELVEKHMFILDESEQFVADFAIDRFACRV